MPEETPQKRKPECTAILLCERAIYNEGTFKNTIIEIHDEIHVVNLPTSLAPLMAYTRLHSGIGGYAIRFEVHNLETNEIINNTGENRIEFGSREETITLISDLPNTVFDNIGFYDLVLFADDIDIARFTFRLIAFQEDEEDHGEQEEER